MNLRDFVGNPDVWAEQLPDRYQPYREPLTDALLEAHKSGERSVGTYVLNYDKARFFVFDVDERNLPLTREIANRCLAHGFMPGVEFSGKKGYHVWVLLGEWYPAEDVQRMAKAIAAEAGFTGEVFPKQGVARDLGNLVKLPLGKHAVSGEWSKFLTTPAVVPGIFERELPKLPAPVLAPIGTDIRPCIDSIQSDPPKPGSHERNTLYFHLACWLRRMGLHEEGIRAVLEVEWQNPDPGELEGVVRNSAFSGPTCDQVSAARHCGAACIKSRTGGLSVRPGQLRHAVEGELIVVESGKHVPGSNTVEFKHPDTEVAKAVLRKGP